MQERIQAIDEYRPDISYKDGWFILKIKFKTGWRMIDAIDPEVIACSQDDKIPGMYWFVSKIGDADSIFDLVDDIIAVNKELEKKIILYKEKIKELEELILSDMPYEKLITLQFTFPEEKKKPKKSSKKINATDTAQTSDEMAKNSYTDALTGKEYSQAPITSESPAEGVIIASETISDIDDKIAKAIGE